jgi:hypothetical protein
MKFSDFIKQPVKEPTIKEVPSLLNPPRIFCHVPAQKYQGNLYLNETIQLAMGNCPICGHDLKTEVDLQRRKVFYQCDGNAYHYFVRDSM